MIGKISGRVDYRSADHVLIDVRGVGYMVYCSEATLLRMPARGEAVALYTDLLVREDNLQLFGFLTLAEKEWHKLLTSVQGVGAKVALAIAGTLGTDGVSRAITLGDATAVKAAPGVGPKLAQRIVAELKDKAPTIMAMGDAGAIVAEADADAVIETPATPAPPSSPAPASAPTIAAAQADALSALVNLGYGHGEAAGAVAQAAESGADSSSALIKGALRLLAPDR